MLISIMGSQGSGKSRLLAGLEERGYQVVYRKTSRSILEEWNITLDEVNANNNLCKRFQDKITARKLEDEMEAIQSKDIWFTERTHTDLFVYALMNLGKFNENSSWVNEYYETCKTNNQYYAGVFFIPGGQFQIEYDGVRGSNHHYAAMIDVTMEHFMKKMFQDSLTNKLKYITMSNIDERIDFVIQNLNELALNANVQLKN